MRIFVSLGVVVAMLAACSDFNGVDPTTSPGVDAGSDANDSDGAVVGDDSFVLDPVGDTVTVVQPKATAVPVSIRRGKNLTAAISVKVTGFPDGISAPSILVDGTSGTLQLSATTASAQGNIDGMIEASAGEKVITTPLKTFVRGAHGALDTRWAKGGKVTASDASHGCKPADLLLGPSDDLYAIVAEHSAGSSDGAVHLDANGVVDTAYGGGWAPLNEPNGQARAATLDGTGRLVVVGGKTGGATCVDRLLATTGGADLSVCNTYVGSTILVSSGAYAAAVRDDNHIFFAFDAQNGASEVDCGVAHFDETGAGVTTFNTKGAIRNTISVPIGIFVANGANGALTVLSIGTDSLFYSKYDADNATLPPGYATPKTASIPGATRPAAGAQGFVTLADASIVVPVNGSSGLYLVALSATGDPVTTFGASGIAGPTTLGGSGKATGIAVQGDGKLLVSLDNGGLLRFTTTGTLDPDFGSGGLAQTSGGTDSLHRKVVVQKTTGRILVSGEGASASEAIVSAYWP